MNYIPSRSAIAFLEKQYQPLPIPQKEETYYICIIVNS